MSPSLLAWGEALLHSLWQVPLLAVGACLVEQAWAHRATTRHAIRTMAMLAVPIVLLGTWLTLRGAADAVGSVAAVPAGMRAEPEPVGPMAWMLLVWCVGAAAMTLRTIAQWRAVQALRRTATALPAHWQRRVEAIARGIGLETPRVALSVACEVPLVLGVLRPLVLLPAGLLHGVPPHVIEAALAHELMHLRRFDPWMQAIQVGIEVVVFFNPAVWWLSRRLAVERELACDEAVVRARRQSPRHYAGALVELEAWRSRPAPALTLGLGGPGLRDRVLQLVRPRPVRRARRWAARAGLVLTLGAAVAVVGGSAQDPAHGDPSADRLGIVWLPQGVRRHEVEIERAARRHGVDPALLAIVVWTESRGRADARSPVGARGLLQLMPSTAADITRRRGLPALPAERLDDPQTNLDLGAWYLARQLEHYDNLPLALAAYNAGPGRVAAFVRGEASLPEETQRYQQIITALWRERALPWSPTLRARARS